MRHCCSAVKNKGCLVRGFLGDYDLTVTSGGTTTVATASMPNKAGQSVTITLP